MNSIVLSTRPDWTRSTTGIPIDCVVKIHGGNTPGRQDIQCSRSRLSVLRLGAQAARPEDEFDVNYVYGQEATNADLVSRSIMPLIRKFVEGYNVTVMTFGSTGSGKTTVLEGPRGKDARNTADGSGVVHLTIDELYKQLNDKAVSVGNSVAEKRRLPSAKAFDFFLESSYVEVYNEECHDLYQKANAVKAKLPVYEDETEGYQVSGMILKIARNSNEMRTNFNAGRMQRDMSKEDVGAVHERASALFTIYLAQYAPAAVPGEEDRIMVSRMTFVDMPGAERLAQDPELLRLREGWQLNKSLLSFGAALRLLAEGNAAFVNYEDSNLTKLLAEALGGNSLSLMVGTLRQGEWDMSINTLNHITVAKHAKNFPIINHGRARGLLHKLRHRLLSIVDDRQVLRDQLQEAPAEGDPNSMAISIAKMRDLEARLLAEREEKSALVEEKQALQGRLMKVREAGAGDLQDRAELQDALIKSEEQRLQLSRALIDFQMEYNDARGEWENHKFELEQKVLEMEAAHVERFVSAADHAALEQERDELNSELLKAQDELERKQAALDAANAELAELRAEVRRLNGMLNALGQAADGDGRALLDDHDHNGGNHGVNEVENGEPDGAAAPDPKDINDMRRKLIRELKKKERRIQEQQVEANELRREVDQLRNGAALNRASADDVREGYRRKLEILMRDVADMSRAVAIMEKDRGTGLKVSAEDLFNKFQKLADENIAITEAREEDMRLEMDEVMTRHVELKRKFKGLYLAYRNLRYLVEDQWPAAEQPPQVLTEEQVCGAAMESLLRSEEEADRRTIAKLRDKTAQLESQLSSLHIAEVAEEAGVTLKGSNVSSGPRQHINNKTVEIPIHLEIENKQLRDELDNMRRKMASAGDMKELKANGGSMSGSNDALVQQLREFATNTQMELERKVQSAESRATMAEEQLDGLQKYMSQASVSYQREIVRLRAVIGQVENQLGVRPGDYLNMNPLDAAGRTNLKPAEQVLDELVSRKANQVARQQGQARQQQMQQQQQQQQQQARTQRLPNGTPPRSPIGSGGNNSPSSRPHSSQQL